MSSMIESLAQSRHAERYRGSRQRPAAATHAAATHAPAVRHDATDARRDDSAPQTTRSRAGWLLIGLGLRLALPGDRPATRRITLTGR